MSLRRLSPGIPSGSQRNLKTSPELARAYAHDGHPALHAAAQDGDTLMITSSLVHGADANVRNDAGQTPLAIARSHAHAKAVELLHQHGGVE
jgi:ankyrin repeat protein